MVKEKFNLESTDVLYEYLSKFNELQLKEFYTVMVHYWLSKKWFISNTSFMRLWTKFNDICWKEKKGFPNPYKARTKLVKYCQKHPFYFIDIIPPKTVAMMFVQHLDKKLSLLAKVVELIYNKGLRETFEYINKEFELKEDIDSLVKISEELIKNT